MTPELADFIDKLLASGGRAPWLDLDAAAAARQALDDIRAGRIVMVRPGDGPKAGPSDEAEAS